jgi:predicted nucleotidyltransferase|tara:strand:+ start:653 stop:1246 length:594 start_codon:yes stop_codon:yes gene_type:complete
MLLKEILKKQESRKIFGKKEIEIILKQLDGITLTQSERNRLSRDIKPKLKIIGELSNHKESFKLKKNQNNKEIIKKATNIILQDELKENIQAIILFGSFADKSFTKRSDIDIGVLFKKDISKKDAAKFRIRILGELPNKLDVQVFNTLPQKIKRSIAKNHKILYRDNKFDNIEFTINYLKDEDYFLRMKKIFGVAYA